MAITSKHTIGCYQRIQREIVYIALLQEALKGIADLKAKKTLSIAQLKSRHGR